MSANEQDNKNPHRCARLRILARSAGAATIGDYHAEGARAADLIVSIDRLQCFSEAQIHARLADMRRLSPKAYIKADLRPAERLTPTGENPHQTLRPRDWWREALAAHFGSVHEAPFGDANSAEFITWALKPADLKALKRLETRRRRRLSLQRACWRLINHISLWRRPPVSHKAVMARLEGKSVAIVGNAASLSASDHGALIDSHDIVLRFNRMPIISTRAQGARADWLLTARALDEEIAQQRGLSLILWRTPSLKRMAPWMSSGRIGLYRIDPAFRDALRAALGATPSSGATAICLLARGDLARLSLFGFDFMQSATLSGDIGADDSDHDFAREAQFLTRLIETDPRITLYR